MGGARREKQRKQGMFRSFGVFSLLATAVVAFEQARILYPDADCTLNSAKFAATAASKCNEQTLATYSDWHEVYMRWNLRELHNWGNVTKATMRLYTVSSTGPAHMYVQHLSDTSWGSSNGGGNMKWHTRPRLGQIVSSFKAYSRKSNQIDVTEQVQYMMTQPLPAQKMFAIRIFQEGQTMVPFGGAGVWQRFNSLENDDYHTRPWLEITTDCAGCIGAVDDFNQDNTYEGVDGNLGTPLDA